MTRSIPSIRDDIVSVITRLENYDTGGVYADEGGRNLIQRQVHKLERIEQNLNLDYFDACATIPEAQNQIECVMDTLGCIICNIVGVTRQNCFPRNGRLCDGKGKACLMCSLVITLEGAVTSLNSHN